MAQVDITPDALDQFNILPRVIRERVAKISFASPIGLK
jgi:hypothetical protein